jgi:hypothetical protein
MKKKDYVAILALVLLHFLIAVDVIDAANYYVRPATVQYNGDGNGPQAASYTGQPGTAWRGFSSVQWGTAGVVAGDTLYLIGGEKYTNESLVIGASGSAGNQITISIYGNSTATIDCDNSQSSPFRLNGKDYITIDGIRGNAVNGDYNYGIRIINLAAGAGGVYDANSPASSHIIIRHLEIIGNQTASTSDDQGGIKIATGGYDYEVANCWIHGLVESPVESRWAISGITIWATNTGTGFESTNIHHNLVENLAHDGIKTNSNASIYNNIVRSVYRPGYHSDSILIQSGNYAKIYNNYVNSQQQSIYIDNVATEKRGHIYIYNNVIDSPNNSGVGINLDPENGDLEDIHIYNNTIYRTVLGAIRGAGRPGRTVRYLYIKNNIFGPVSLPGESQVLIRPEWTLGEDDAFEHNVYLTGSAISPKVIDFQGMKMTIDELKTLNPPRELGGIYTGGYFRDAARGDLRLSNDCPNSIKINGVDLSTIFTTDKDGRARTIWSKGAYEWRSWSNLLISPKNFRVGN